MFKIGSDGILYLNGNNVDLIQIAKDSINGELYILAVKFNDSTPSRTFGINVNNIEETIKELNDYNRRNAI